MAALPAILLRFMSMLRSASIFPLEMPFLSMKYSTFTIFKNFLAMIGRFCSIFGFVLLCFLMFVLWREKGFVRERRLESRGKVGEKDCF